LRGRRPVRADRRKRADEKRISALSTILDRTPHSLCFFNNRDFHTDALFIRMEIPVGARSAQWPLLAIVQI